MIFLSELKEFDLIDNSFTVNPKDHYKKACFHFQYTLNPKSFIYAIVSNKIKVKITTDIVLCDKIHKKS